MDFDKFDKTMRQYEQALDQTIVPGMYIVARLDGNGFSKMTYNEGFEKPFDEKFRDMMVLAAKECMNSGFRIVFGYTQSDEISLLFHVDDDAYGRKVRKIVSLLAGAASARFSLELGCVVKFDCRVAAVPNVQTAVDEFLWRQEDCNRNALNGYCYWTLRQKDGMTRGAATSALKKISISDKNELLFQRGINYNDVPAWTKRGVGLYYKPVRVVGKDPRTGKDCETFRTKLVTDYNLPYGKEYDTMLKKLIADSSLSRKERFEREQQSTSELTPEDWVNRCYTKGDRIYVSALQRQFNQDWQKVAADLVISDIISENVLYRCLYCNMALMTEKDRQLQEEQENLETMECYNCDQSFIKEKAVKETLYIKE